jgi:hypothetical protein
MDDRKGNVTATNASAVVSFTVGEFTVQRSTWLDGEKVWVTCYNTLGGYRDGTTISVPAVYDDISEADEQLNHFRDTHPMGEYRMVQTTTIVQVVYA